MFRLSMATAMAAIVFAVLSAEHVAAELSPLDTADNLLTFNITVLPTWGIVHWTPLQEMDPPNGDLTPWQAMFEGRTAPDKTTLLFGKGTPKFIMNASKSDIQQTPSTWFQLPAEAAYWRGSFRPNNGDDSALRFWADNLPNNNSMTRQSAPDFIRYYDGKTHTGMKKFVQQKIYFGVVQGFVQGGQLEFDDVTVRMSMVTTAPDWPSAINNADKRYFFTSQTDLSTLNYDSMTCTKGARPATFKDGNGREYLYVTWRSSMDESCTIDVPQNTSMVYVNGTTGPFTDGFKYQWIPGLPGDMANATTGNANTKARFVRTNEPLVVQILDPRVKYSLKITSDLSKTDNITLHSATFFRAAWNNQLPTFNGGKEGGNANVVSTKSNNSNKGAIIGGAVGGVLGAVFIAGLAIYLCVMHRRKHAKESTNLPGKPMDVVDANITPYVALDRSRPPHSDTPLSEAPSSTMASRPLNVRAGTMDSDSQFWSDDGRSGQSSPTGFASFSSIPSTSKSPPPSTISRPPMARREVISEMDAGTLEPISDTVEYEYVPPQYNPDWARSNESTVSSRAAQHAHRHRSAMGASTLGADSNAGDYDTAGSVQETLGPMSPTSTIHSTGMSTNYSSARSHNNYSSNY